jgi:phosphatidate cytidylyltransferase
MNENVVRSLSGLVYIFLLISATLYSKETFILIFGLFLIQTTIEFCNLTGLSKIYSLGLATIFYFLFTVFNVANNYLDIVLVIFSLCIETILILWLFDFKNLNLKSSLKWLILIGYIVLPFVFITKLPIGNRIFIPSIIISIFILIWTNDTFAYIVGKLIGQKKLFEKVSPKKTVEGFIGGMLFSIIASIIIAKYYVEKPMFIWVITAIIIGFFGTLGDLIESKFKRTANVKDSGNIMPGHGGMLDRLDSIIFVSPFLFLFYKIIIYVS